MSETRIIKKYPNRRLYDTAISSYITLEDVKRLVLDDVSIQVIDARSKTDITHNTLLQIIVEQEENGPPIFTTEVLQNLIRFYGSRMQNVAKGTFEQAVAFFSEQHSLLKSGVADGVDELVKRDPLDMILDKTKQNSEAWQTIQDQWVRAFKQNEPEATVEPEQAQTDAPFYVRSDQND